ncbi:MAG: hypothetical protein ACYCXZ_00955 [Coriobacteriia bacterium]
MIEDPDLARYYDHLSLVTSGPLWSAQRWRTILGMHLGRYDHPIDRDFYRYEAQPPYDPALLW